MSAVTAHITSGAVTLTALRKGDIGNRILYREKIPAAGATGATTVSVLKSADGVTIDVKLKNTSGTTITATKAEVLSALSGSADVQALATVVLASAATGADTGVAYTGSGGGFLAAVSGAEGTNTVVYDDLAAATGDGWVKQSGNNIDIFTRVRADGTEERQAAVSVTGATAGVLSAGRTMDRLSRKGGIGASGLVGA